MMSDRPDNLDESGGQRDASGRFVKGHVGLGGRPKGLDFRNLIKEHRGETIEVSMVAVFDALLAAATAGDVAASRLLLDRLVDDSKEGGSVSVQVITGVPRSTDEDA